MPSRPTPRKGRRSWSKPAQRLSDPEQAVLHEAPKGYDLLIVGLGQAIPGGGFDPEIAKAARAYAGPSAVVLARGVHDDDPIGGRIKILAPITGTAISRRAAEVSIELARATHADITILYVSPSQTLPNAISQQSRQLLARRHGEAVLKEVVEVADHYEVRLRTKIKISDRPYVAILDEARQSQRHLDRSGSRRTTERCPALRQHCRSIARNQPKLAPVCGKLKTG